MTDTFDEFWASLPEDAPTPATAPNSSASARVSTIPGTPAITIANAYFFDNGEEVAPTQRYKMTFQLYDHTEPFTPHHSLAAWTGTARLLHPQDFYDWMQAYHARHKAFPEQHRARYNALIAQVDAKPRTDAFPLLGQLFTGPGTIYEWNNLVIVDLNGTGEMEADLLLSDDGKIMLSFIDSQPVPNGPKKFAIHNPHALWAKPKHKFKKK